MVLEGGDQDLVQGNAHGSDTRREKIFVSVRLRPLNGKEIQSNDFADWECINNTTIIFKNCLAERSMYPNAYNFDRVFGNDCSTKRVYEEAAKEVALSVLNGINSSVFAYGQTSSGKTFTMSGITHCAVSDIYDYVEKHKEREFVMKFSAIEIYNEHVRDLLSPDPTPLRCLDDPETIESSARRFGGGTSSMLAANVNFVDLAGSERTSQTLSTGTRLKEGSHINRSLLTLGKVIRTLSKGRNAHVPYRDSKLTRILHNSLGGNARTAIICTMSPAHSHLEQSRNTLLFASCAKEVSTNAQVNVVMSDKALVKQLKKELAKLETELKTISSVSTKDDMEKEMKELSRQRDLAQSRIEELLRTTGSHQFSRPQDDLSSRQTSESREKISWLDDSSVTSDISDYQRLDVDLATSESFQYLDEHTDFDYTTQASNVFDNYNHNATLDFAPPDWEKMTAVTTRIDEVMEDNCKEVHCIEVEANLDNKTNLSDPLTGFSQKVIEKEREKEKEKEKKSAIEKESIVSVEEIEGRESNKSQFEVLMTNEVDVIPLELKEEMESMIVKEHTMSSAKDQEFENETSDVKCEAQLSEKGYTNSSEKEEKLSDNSKAEKECTLSSEKKDEIKVENHCDSDYEQLVQRIKELQKTIDSLANRNPLEHYSPSMESERLTNRRSNLSRSMSCKAVLSTIRATPTFDTVVQHHQNQSFGGFDQVTVTERPKKLAKGLDADDRCDADTSILGFPSSIRDAIRIEMDQDVRNSDVSDSSSIYSTVAGTNGDAKHNPHKLTAPKLDGIMDDLSEPKYSESSDSVRDIASCGMQERDCMSEGTPSSLQSPLNWSEEFENTRVRIIELWHACHIPLVHRTYFYLLFKGDPSDKLYLEVELRRLSFIKNRFDQGQKIVMDGQISTASSSMKGLNQEREMLMKQMYKTIPFQERESLFEKWGIAINSKQRRLQLAQQLWTDSKDMQHIRESASLVAKLVGFVDDGQVAKEMFVGPSLTPKTIINRRSYSWKSTIPSLA
ncbi:hypothetical protein KSS87_021720 [Heliosperma pusillum]|nr:hypothetical protein KSS87_021720 [Heliosperma pusillum]